MEEMVTIDTCGIIGELDVYNINNKTKITDISKKRQ